MAGMTYYVVHAVAGDKDGEDASHLPRARSLSAPASLGQALPRLQSSVPRMSVVAAWFENERKVTVLIQILAQKVRL